MTYQGRRKDDCALGRPPAGGPHTRLSGALAGFLWLLCPLRLVCAFMRVWPRLADLAHGQRRMPNEQAQCRCTCGHGICLPELISGAWRLWRASPSRLRCPQSDLDPTRRGVGIMLGRAFDACWACWSCRRSCFGVQWEVRIDRHASSCISRSGQWMSEWKPHAMSACPKGRGNKHTGWLAHSTSPRFSWPRASFRSPTTALNEPCCFFCAGAIQALVPHVSMSLPVHGAWLSSLLRLAGHIGVCVPCALSWSWVAHPEGCEASGGGKAAILVASLFRRSVLVEHRQLARFGADAAGFVNYTYVKTFVFCFSRVQRAPVTAVGSTRIARATMPSRPPV